jgi:Bax protein
MSSNTSQQKIDGRNLFFAIGGLVVVLLILTTFIEKRSGTITPKATINPQEVGEPQVISKAAVIQKTTVNIQPMMTWFPPPPDFNLYNTVDKRKAAFIDYLTPIVEYQNVKILWDRGHLEQILRLIVNGETLSDTDEKWLEQLAKKYDVEWKEGNPGAVVIKLASRVDIIPVSLAIVQAAKESSWGRSRYAVECNNLFGQWCYDEGCGVIPLQRLPDAKHEVKKFKSANDATRSYIHNLNTHPQYKTLRKIRQQLRVHHRPLTGKAFADGLLYYSQRREIYVEEVKTMIRQYRLFQEWRTI